MSGAIVVALSPEKKPVNPPRDIDVEVERMGDLVKIKIIHRGQSQWVARVNRVYADNLARALLEVSA